MYARRWVRRGEREEMDVVAAPIQLPVSTPARASARVRVMRHAIAIVWHGVSLSGRAFTRLSSGKIHSQDGAPLDGPRQATQPQRLSLV